MTTRLPQKRYIGDGVYASHDGYQIILETSDGIQATNRIGLDDDTLEGIQKYRQYALEFYRTGQHQVGPGCEECGKEIIRQDGAMLGEVYRFQHDEATHEVRLCQECAKTVDQALLVRTINRRKQED